MCDEKIITILVDYDFYNNTKSIIAKRHNYQGGENLRILKYSSDLYIFTPINRDLSQIDCYLHLRSYISHQIIKDNETNCYIHICYVNVHRLL